MPTGKSIKPAALIKVAAILTVLIAVSAWFYSIAFGTYRFVKVDPGVLCTTGLRDITEFSNACTDGRVNTIFVLMDKVEREADLNFSAIKYGYKNKLKVVIAGIQPGTWPTSEQIKLALKPLTTPNAAPSCSSAPKASAGRA
jgi:hypothetical protein